MPYALRCSKPHKDRNARAIPSPRKISQSVASAPGGHGLAQIQGHTNRIGLLGRVAKMVLQNVAGRMAVVWHQDIFWVHIASGHSHQCFNPQQQRSSCSPSAMEGDHTLQMAPLLCFACVWNVYLRVGAKVWSIWLHATGRAQQHKLPNHLM